MLRITMSLRVKDAVLTFARIRPPGIYKEDYIASLFDYYHERRCPSQSCLARRIPKIALPLRRIKSHAHTNARDRKPFVHMLSLQGIGFRICDSGP